MKKCAKCNIEKEENEFVKNKAKKNGLSPYCKQCKREIDSDYYKNNDNRRKNLKDRRDKNYIETSTFIKKYLSEHPCVDCGKTDIRVLDFDHINGKKEYNIGAMKSLSIGTIKREIEKCEIRCAYCHRIKHWDEKEN